ncbi:MAG: hypothetical protein HOP30_00705, partial [Cyclobacteriaceae bacterium]|nr:hypothetical protein [Cyclobacteriaceae bacterium]
APVADLTYQNKLNGQQITKDEFTALLPADQSNYVSIGVIPTCISDPGGARFYLLTDTYPTDAAIATAVTNNQSFIRFVHASPNAPGVFVRLVPTSSGSTINLVTSAAQYVMSVAGGFNPSVGSRSATAGFTTTSTGSAATTYNVEIHSNSGFTALVLSVPNVSFTPGKIYTIVAKGLLGKTGASGLAAVIVTHN